MGFLEETDLSSAPSIPEFYKNKTVFITGGTGFIGKVLIEKLLYSCPELEKIYLLMRSKKGVNPEDRLRKLYNFSCFDRLRKEKPGILESKIQIISGDILKDGFDLSEEDRLLIVNRVNVVLHVAASVRFDDKLAYSVKMNLKGAYQMIQLAKEIKDLSVFVYVSTAYSNTIHNPIDEKMYTPLMDWSEVLELTEQVDSHSLDILTTKIIDVMPNTYTFTKHLTEHMLYEMKGQLPIVIIRPSIVVAAYDEPIPGWIENFNGPVGFFVGVGKGVLRSIFANPELQANYIPVDHCVKNIIAVSWIRGIKKIEATDDVEIYNCCSGEKYIISLQVLTDIAEQETAKQPLNDILWTVSVDFTTSRTLHYLRVFFKQILPAIFIDTILWLLGKKTMLVKVQRSIFRANIALEYYLTQSWDFVTENMTTLLSILKQEDIKDFDYRTKDFDVVWYYENTFLSARRYLLHEKDEDLPKAKKHYNRMFWLDLIVRAAFIIFVIWWIVNKFVF